MALGLGGWKEGGRSGVRWHWGLLPLLVVGGGRVLGGSGTLHFGVIGTSGCRVQRVTGSARDPTRMEMQHTWVVRQRGRGGGWRRYLGVAAE